VISKSRIGCCERLMSIGEAAGAVGSSWLNLERLTLFAWARTPAHYWRRLI
jgi:hypothetical protein